MSNCIIFHFPRNKKTNILASRLICVGLGCICTSQFRKQVKIADTNPTSVKYMCTYTYSVGSVIYELITMENWLMWAGIH